MIMLSSRRASAPMMWTSSWSRRSFSVKESRFTDVNGFQKIYLEIGTIELGSILWCMQDLGSSIMFCSNFYFGLRITTRKSYRWKYSLRVLVSINPHSSNRPFHHSPTWKNSTVTSWITAQFYLQSDIDAWLFHFFLSSKSNHQRQQCMLAWNHP